jgi:hypothetical protein
LSKGTRVMAVLVWLTLVFFMAVPWAVRKMFIYTEDGKDYAQCLYKSKVTAIKNDIFGIYKKHPDMVAFEGYWSGVDQIVAVKGGQHSGNERCLMRYYFAKFYPKDGTSDTFYTRYQCENPSHLSDEPIGLQLDRSRQGTGVNDSGHSPQSRYFDANEIRGDCVHQIVVNDSANPKDRSIKKASN